MDEFNNGHDAGEMATQEAFKGAVLDVAKLKREDGILTRGLTSAQQGVLQRAMTAIKDDDDYRQELKTAFFLSTDEADKVSAAIAEADRYGCSRKPIVDWVIARSAGTNGGRLRRIFEAITHTTFNTNYDGKKGGGFSSDKSRSKSPLS